MEEILSKVVNLYIKYGVRSVTMDDVAREMGISKKTLYRYFKDKNELVEKVVEYQYEHVNSHCANIRSTGKNAIDELLELHRFVTLHLRDFSASYEYDLNKYYPDVFRKLIEKKRESMYNMVLANIRRGKKEGLYREELDDEIISKMHVWRIESMKDNPVFPLEKLISGKLFRELFIYHIRGIANEKGIQFLEDNIEKLDHIELDKLK